MSAKQPPPHARGSLKEALGKITGDPEVEAQGRAEKHGVRGAPEPAKVPGRAARTGRQPV
ncbi:hypothetical protein GCM10007890_37280 [Methylobacterium tardum]|uniref:CsbD family protein n=1 Tax=Methylobacterium tardum TaxID=374432 RepID=A0AA37THB7_9HYPH|nr:hypothetical protein GCM10007890_37280 [Methylobacterium tardum]